jgi:hypothetical protein
MFSGQMLASRVVPHDQRGLLRWPHLDPGHDQFNYDNTRFVTPCIVDGGECANPGRLVRVAGLMVSVSMKLDASGV